MYLLPVEELNMQNLKLFLSFSTFPALYDLNLENVPTQGEVRIVHSSFNILSGVNQVYVSRWI